MHVPEHVTCMLKAHEINAMKNKMTEAVDSNAGDQLGNEH